MNFNVLMELLNKKNVDMEKNKKVKEKGIFRYGNK